MSKKGERILVAEERCSGCQRCALACSFFTSPEKAFNLSKSKIMVMPAWELGHFEIKLSDECTHCAICIPYCEFGALTRQGEVKAPTGSYGPTSGSPFA